MPYGLNARIANDHHAPRTQLGRQFAQRIDLLRTEDNAGTGVEVEWRHSGVRSAEFGVRSVQLRRHFWLGRLSGRREVLIEDTTMATISFTSCIRSVSNFSRTSLASMSISIQNTDSSPSSSTMPSFERNSAELR